ncbi:MAG: DeoR/GlpR transcriptional regulator [Fibrobacterota bacterium]
MGINKVAKKAIGKKASELITDNDTLFIDCGSTPFQIAQHLIGKKNIRIITNSLPVVSELIHDSEIRIIFLGGEVVNTRHATQGAMAERFIAEYRADKAFIGADGFSFENGLSAYDEREGAVSLKMMEQSRESYLVCDSSKLEKDSLYRFAPVTRLTALITDDRAQPEIISRLRKQNITVITA